MRAGWLEDTCLANGPLSMLRACQIGNKHAHEKNRASLRWPGLFFILAEIAWAYSPSAPSVSSIGRM